MFQLMTLQKPSNVSSTKRQILSSLRVSAQLPGKVPQQVQNIFDWFLALFERMNLLRDKKIFSS